MKPLTFVHIVAQVVGTSRECVTIGVKGIAQVTVAVFKQIKVAWDAHSRGGMQEAHGRAVSPFIVGCDRERFEDHPAVVDYLDTRRLNGCICVLWFVWKLIRMPIVILH